MGRIHVAVDEAHRHHVDAVGDQALRGGQQPLAIERAHDRAVGGDPLVDFEAVAALDQGLGLLPREVEEIGRAHAPDLEHVPEPPRGQEPDARALLLEDGVGRHRGAVHDLDDGRGGDAGRVEERVEPAHHREPGILGRGGDLADP